METAGMTEVFRGSLARLRFGLGVRFGLAFSS